MAHNCPNNIARVAKGEYQTGCITCINNPPEAEFAQKYRRDRMVENHRKDLLQASTDPVEFAKAYPKEAEKRFGRKGLEDLRI